MPNLDRRQAIAGLSALGLAAPFGLARAGRAPIITRPIPSTGERIPVIGMGSWITFNVGADEGLRAARRNVLQAFFDAGGGLVDSSPMYGSSEEVIGYCLKHIENTQGLFSATKVWTPMGFMGRRQMATSERLWGERPFDLMQIHNLVNWEGHLETMRAWKAEGRLRYLGITTSHGSRHREFERVMAEDDLDFAQFTYNIVDRRAEARLLPAAAERGLAVIINRPFRQGSLVDRLARMPLPPWAGEIGCKSWAQFLLKFIVSHPAVSCAIPATSRVDHMIENMTVLRGPLPDQAMRRRMIDYVTSL